MWCTAGWGQRIFPNPPPSSPFSPPSSSRVPHPLSAHCGGKLLPAFLMQSSPPLSIISQENKWVKSVPNTESILIVTSTQCSTCVISTLCLELQVMIAAVTHTHKTRVCVVCQAAGLSPPNICFCWGYMEQQTSHSASCWCRCWGGVCHHETPLFSPCHTYLARAARAFPQPSPCTYCSSLTRQRAACTNLSQDLCQHVNMSNRPLECHESAHGHSGEMWHLLHLLHSVKPEISFKLLNFQ